MVAQHKGGRRAVRFYNPTAETIAPSLLFDFSRLPPGSEMRLDFTRLERAQLVVRTEHAMRHDDRKERSSAEEIDVGPSRIRIDGARLAPYGFVDAIVEIRTLGKTSSDRLAFDVIQELDGVALGGVTYRFEQQHRRIVPEAEAREKEGEEERPDLDAWLSSRPPWLRDVIALRVEELGPPAE